MSVIPNDWIRRSVVLFDIKCALFPEEVNSSPDIADRWVSKINHAHEIGIKTQLISDEQNPDTLEVYKKGLEEMGFHLELTENIGNKDEVEEYPEGNEINIIDADDTSYRKKVREINMECKTSWYHPCNVDSFKTALSFIESGVGITFQYLDCE